MNPILVGSPGPSSAPVPLYELESVFSNLLTFSIPLVAIAAFVVITMAGYKFITAGDDPKKAASARGTLTVAIGGLILAAMAYLIIQTIGVFAFGTPINPFKAFRIYQP